MKSEPLWALKGIACIAKRGKRDPGRLTAADGGDL